MSEIVTIRRTYKYRMYRASRNRRLHQRIDIAGIIWNHCAALQRRYYRLTGRYISIGRLKAHIARLRMKTQRYNYWQRVGSQAIQDIIERLDKAYQRFFDKQGGIPSFKKVKKYRSFTLKQAGWKLPGKNRIELLGRTYKFVKHREMDGIMFFEDLNLDGIKRLWGRKVSDLGFGQFVQILQHVASMRSKEVRFIDRFEPTSQICSGCGHRQKLELRERILDCQNCGLVIDRDHNAAINIKRVGISTLRLEVIRRSSERCLV